MVVGFARGRIAPRLLQVDCVLRIVLESQFTGAVQAADSAASDGSLACNEEISFGLGVGLDRGQGRIAYATSSALL
jgi:hypothetical protein